MAAMDLNKVMSELLEAARAAGVSVRELRDAAGEPKPRSALVRVRGRRVLFLDPALPEDERLRLVVESLKGLSLDDVYLSPMSRSLLESKAAEKPAR